MEVFDKMMIVFDREVERMASVISSVTKQFRLVILPGMEICRDEAVMLRLEGSFDVRKRYSIFKRVCILLRWAYFPGDVLSLKFSTKLKEKTC